MDFGAILKRSWSITWKHKVLWIFGILAGCGSSGGGGGGSNSGTFRNTGGGNPFDGTNGFTQLPPWARQALTYFQNIPVWVYVVAGLFFLLLVAAAIVLGVMGRIGLVHGSRLADDVAEVGFGKVWRESTPFFWRVFLLGLLVGGVVLAAVIVLTVPFIGLGALTKGVGLACIAPIICLLVPVFWAVSILSEQATIAIIVENLGVIASLKRAWEVVKKNIGPYIVMTLILMIGRTVAGFLIGLPVLIILVPILVGVFASNQSIQTAGWGVAGLILLVYLPVAILLGGILQTYVTSAWTLTFRRCSAVKSVPSDSI